MTSPGPLQKCGGLGADHGQKRELGGVTSLGRLDITGPITEGRVLINAQIAAPLWLPKKLLAIVVDQAYNSN